MTSNDIKSFLDRIAPTDENILKALHNKRLLSDTQSGIKSLKQASSNCNVGNIIYDCSHINHIIGMLTDRRFRNILDVSEINQLNDLQNELANIQLEISKVKGNRLPYLF